MTVLCIIDRDPLRRARLERELARFGTIVSAAPDDARWREAGAVADAVADVVVLGASELEDALAFADAQATRLRRARWLVLHDPRVEGTRAQALFAGLDCACLAWPSPPGALERTLLGLLAPRPRGLAARRRLHALEAQAGRFFQDLDLAVLSRRPSLDRLLVRGEPGTGRLLLVHLLHARGGDRAGTLLTLPCTETTSPEDVARAQSERLAADASGGPITLCLMDADRLSEATQRVVQGWIELGGTPELPPARWCATAGPAPRWAPGWAAGLAPESPLETALGRHVVELPPLRERSALIEPFAVLAIADACARRGVSPPVLGEDALSALASHPWLGNLRELESVIARTLEGLPEPAPEVLGTEHLALEPGTPLTAGLQTSASADHDDLPDAEDALEALGGESFTAEPAPQDPPQLVPMEPEPVEGTLQPTADTSPGPSSDGHADAPGSPALEDEAPGAAPTERAEQAALLARLAGSMAHEVRNPLVTLRTFASLLPERHQDPEFRDEFGGQVLAEVERIESLLDRLQELADVGSPKLTSVDATGLLEGLLEEHRPEIQRRRLLVLQELDPTRPLAIADPELLRLALASLLHRALAWVPERADLFVASKYHTVGRNGGPTVQILLRFYSPDQASPSPSDKARQALGLDATSIDVLFAEHLVALQNGSLRFEHGQPDETLVILDLPAVE